MLDSFRILAALCAVTTSGSPDVHHKPLPPNVLIILADDLGIDHVGVYAAAKDPAPTPHLDQLGRQGVLFQNAWSNPICSPSRACIQTGRHAFRTGVGTALPLGGSGALEPSEITLPEALDLGNSGYRHAMFGKWHLSQEPGGELGPNQAGWAHYAGLIPGGTMKPYNYFYWPRTVDGATGDVLAYATTRMVDDALEWIHGGAGPWVCVVSLFAPHRPFHEPPAHLHNQNLSGLIPWQDPRPFYRAAVEAMDTEIGRLLASLGPTLENTTVIFAADNGTPQEVSVPPFLPSHAKGTPYEGGIRVPFIVWGASVEGPARQEDALVGIVDLFATVLDLAGVQPAQVIPPGVTLDSVSLRPLLEQPDAPPVRTSLFSEWFMGTHPELFGWTMMRDERFKLIRRLSPIGASYEELYDLLADPFEKTNLLQGTLDSPQLEAYHHLKSATLALRASR